MVGAVAGYYLCRANMNTRSCPQSVNTRARSGNEWGLQPRSISADKKENPVPEVKVVAMQGKPKVEEVTVDFEYIVRTKPSKRVVREYLSAQLDAMNAIDGENSFRTIAPPPRARKIAHCPNKDVVPPTTGRGR